MYARRIKERRDPALAVQLAHRREADGEHSAFSFSFFLGFYSLFSPFLSLPVLLPSIDSSFFFLCHDLRPDECPISSSSSPPRPTSRHVHTPTHTVTNPENSKSVRRKCQIPKSETLVTTPRIYSTALFVHLPTKLRSHPLPSRPCTHFISDSALGPPRPPPSGLTRKRKGKKSHGHYYDPSSAKASPCLSSPFGLHRISVLSSHPKSVSIFRFIPFHYGSPSSLL